LSEQKVNNIIVTNPEQDCFHIPHTEESVKRSKSQTLNSKISCRSRTKNISLPNTKGKGFNSKQSEIQKKVQRNKINRIDITFSKQDVNKGVGSSKRPSNASTNQNDSVASSIRKGEFRSLKLSTPTPVARSKTPRRSNKRNNQRGNHTGDIDVTKSKEKSFMAVNESTNGDILTKKPSDLNRESALDAEVRSTLEKFERNISLKSGRLNDILDRLRHERDSLCADHYIGQHY